MNTLTTYCGFIAIVGRPNVGKSTLMNHLLGQKISITSRKPQTTRYKINGVLTQDNRQYVFVDTPGFQKLHLSKMNNLLNQAVISAIHDVDVILYVVEAGVFNSADETVLRQLEQYTKRTVILVINKQDTVKDRDLLNAYVKDVRATFSFKDVVLVSAKHGLNLDILLNTLNPYLPSSEFLYASDQLTDKDSRFLVSEIIREKLFRYLGQELPYSTCVVIESYNEDNPELIKISANIIVDKPNQKGIVIGEHGAKLKKIATEARLDSEKLLGVKVFLQLWVKVKSGFSEQESFLKQFKTS